ncbi:MAG: sigma-70 family polymerase sigma factor [Microbacteriaceae bacterium]|nr:sigma-70 family polymerase sigma factor [Microbacteriaceae bacterium]
MHKDEPKSGEAAFHDEVGSAASPDITSDEALVLLARAGDREAFAQLWQRHARSGLTVARQFTSSIDADDLVSEAYVRIYQRVLAGGGPDGAFRPYLYTTIRNLASRWGRADKTVNVEDIGDFEEQGEQLDPASIALDRTMTVRAFRSLPERWQSVLWYTEVEGMDPHEVAPILGMSANGVAALSYRAREGLRKAWLQAHVSDATAPAQCQWTIARLGDYARNGLGKNDRERISDHLATCARCTIINEEVDEVSSHLALVMIPLLLGATVGGALLASLSAPAGAMAATAVAMPAMPPAFALATSAAITAPAVTTGLVASAVTAPLVGTLAVALAVSGGLAITSAVPMPTPTTPTAISQLAPNSVPDILAGPTATPTPIATPGAVVDGTQAAVDGAATGVGGTVNGLVNDLTNPINTILPGLDPGPGPVPEHSAPAGVVGIAASLDLSGRGMPGATVSVQAANTVYATTKVTPQGTWAVHITALPDGIGSLNVKQTLISLLGIDLVSVPLQVLSNSLGITLNILGL